MGYLIAGTQRENIADRDAKGRCRARGLPGEGNGAAKLTEADVRAIRLEYETQIVTFKDIAKRRGVSDTLIRKIVRRQLWQHVA